MLNYFNWNELDLLSQNANYTLSTISWEDSSFILNNDLISALSLVYSTFNSIFFSTSSCAHSSLLNLIFVDDFAKNSLMLSFFLDIFVELSSNFSLLLFTTQLNGPDLLTLNPDFVLFLANYLSYVVIYSDLALSALYDIFGLNVNSNQLLDFINFYVATTAALFFVVALSSFLSFGRFQGAAPVGLFLGRIIPLLNNLSFENRLQLDWSLLFLLLVLLIWVPLLMTYDDVNVEIVELFHSFILFFFIFVISYLIYKYSSHYFSFLENSVSDGAGVAYLAKQFVRDVSNTFALFLRFFLLIFRLNIYDGLDDFLDSYYIFFIDFDEDSYNDELFFTPESFFFFDNREDIVFYNSIELDWWGDLYSRFFIIFGKFFFFWTLILEEIFRVSLAFYISYLIIFEVHAVNLSLNEDRFFFHKTA